MGNSHRIGFGKISGLFLFISVMLLYTAISCFVCFSKLLMLFNIALHIKSLWNNSECIAWSRADLNIVVLQLLVKKMLLCLHPFIRLQGSLYTWGLKVNVYILWIIFFYNDILLDSCLISRGSLNFFIFLSLAKSHFIFYSSLFPYAWTTGASENNHQPLWSIVNKLRTVSLLFHPTSYGVKRLYG